ncbi:TRAP transporter small permease subunit [Paracoccus sanguinis]|uniref:TRAP transporter small permease protein n=1 Tax=Paracoccus sanguinis TaxID=1545044 RepID=A0A1H2W0U0_9RHOB|nr:TRAP transporter small permease [Paracoccus sanguinis]SDW74200.1 TRAP-type C4-dicarboxylate transport system, small permease component [Paracoccus sanguinis]
MTAAADNDLPARLLTGLGMANRAVGVLLGVLLVATVAFVLADVVMRQLGRSLGGSDELSGYGMAILASWGLAVALTERAHVRIDLVRQGLSPRGRAAIDMLAMAALTGIAVLVAYQAWPVLEKTLARGSRANTPLETPLWIPQGIWFGGWLWFAICAVLTLLAASLILARGDLARLESAIGLANEGDEALAEARGLHGEHGGGTA